MARKPEDQACDDLLVDHEAERQDEEARMVEAAAPLLEKAAKQAVKLLAVRKPSKRAIAKANDLILRATLLGMAERANRVQAMVKRQAKERKDTFGKRSGEKLEIEPITAKRIEARKQAVAEAREVKG